MSKMKTHRGPGKKMEDMGEGGKNNNKDIGIKRTSLSDTTTDGTNNRLIYFYKI